MRVSDIQTALNSQGYNLDIDGDMGPLTLAAVKKFQSARGLTPDGIVGPLTAAALGSSPTLVPPVPATLASDAPWMDEAKKFIGWNETNHPTDPMWTYGWSISGLPGWNSIVGAIHAWCRMLVNLMLDRTGYQHGDNDAAAVDASSIGVECELKHGCIFVLEHPSGGHHTTFYDHTDSNGNYVCLGGNQSDSVCYAAYHPSEVRHKRWPVKK